MAMSVMGDSPAAVQPVNFVEATGPSLHASNFSTVNTSPQCSHAVDFLLHPHNSLVASGEVVHRFGSSRLPSGGPIRNSVESGNSRIVATIDSGTTINCGLPGVGTIRNW